MAMTTPDAAALADRLIALRNVLDPVNHAFFWDRMTSIAEAIRALPADDRETSSPSATATPGPSDAVTWLLRYLYSAASSSQAAATPFEQSILDADKAPAEAMFDNANDMLAHLNGAWPPLQLVDWAARNLPSKTIDKARLEELAEVARSIRAEAIEECAKVAAKAYAKAKALDDCDPTDFYNIARDIRALAVSRPESGA